MFLQSANAERSSVLVPELGQLEARLGLRSRILDLPNIRFVTTERVPESVKQQAGAVLVTKIVKGKESISGSIATSTETIKNYICEVFKNSCADALVIAFHESGFNPNAVSRTSDYGVFQLHCPLWCNYYKVSTNDMFDYKTNIQLAKRVFDRSGSFRAWSTYKFLK